MHLLLGEPLIALAVWVGSPAPVASEALNINCEGAAVQGGLLLCTANPGSLLTVAGPDGEGRRDISVNADGIATIGLRRTEPLELTISQTGTGAAPLYLALEAREDPFRTIEGLDCDKVDARTPEQKAHAGRSWQTKQGAFGTFSDGDGARNGFLRPAAGPMSSPFGPARKYIGIGKDGEPCEKTSVHYGYDIAIPVGTHIVAPAAGTVTLADSDLYYEGGTIFLDHGDGLVSVFMHLSDIEVSVGDIVSPGDRLGASGNTGRTSGPHLHWAVKWRNQSAEDRGSDFYIDPALLLDLEIGQ